MGLQVHLNRVQAALVDDMCFDSSLPRQAFNCASFLAGLRLEEINSAYSPNFEAESPTPSLGAFRVQDLWFKVSG